MQTLTTRPVINSSFSAILGISRTQLVQVSNGGYAIENIKFKEAGVLEVEEEAVQVKLPGNPALFL